MDRKKKDPKNNYELTDEVVEEMIAAWLQVRCKICKKKISMLDGILVDGQYYICKGRH